MAYAIKASPEFKEDYKKRCSENLGLKQAVNKKVMQVVKNPLHFKPLHAPLQGVRRVHVAKSFVVLFEVVEERKTVRLLRLAHHDEAYKT